MAAKTSGIPAFRKARTTFPYSTCTASRRLKKLQERRCWFTDLVTKRMNIGSKWLGFAHSSLAAGPAASMFGPATKA